VHAIGWRLLGASARGTSHLESGLPCQDAHRETVLPDGTLVIAVADGAGSAGRADEGAKCAVAASVSHLTGRLQDAAPRDPVACAALLDGALQAARSALQTLAAGGPVDELACTLLLAVVTQQWLAVLQVGDGAVVYHDTSGAFLPASQGGGEGYVNETTFVTSPSSVSEAHKTVRPAADVRGIAVMSDGIQLLAVHHATHAPHEPFFRALFEFAAQSASTAAELAQFLASPRVCERTDDDKTLVIAVRHDPV
jgi:hypothetical protein